MNVQPQRHTMVKVCGITRLEDGRAASEAGADWLGFVIEHDSPRALAAGAVAEILAELPEAVGVGVLVAPSPDRALQLARTAGSTSSSFNALILIFGPSIFRFRSCSPDREAEGTLTAPLPPPDCS